jgi:TolA-binding protein
VKKSFFLSGHLLLIWLTIVLITSSCSLVDSSRRSLLGEPAKAPKNKAQYISRAQYDQLMQKYEKLSVEYDELKQDSVPVEKEIEPIKVQDKSVETVDVFENLVQDQKKSPSKPEMAKVEAPAKEAMVIPAAAMSSSSEGSEENRINEDVLYYNKAVALLENNEIQKALQAFQVLSKNDIPQVRVRAKFQMGRIFMKNNEYDLAMQMFEEILSQHASSGMVIHSLKSLVECSRALGLKSKEKKYTTILRDIFDIT